MQTTHLLLLVPPALALLGAWLGLRAADRGAAEIDAAREALRRRQAHPAE